MTKVFSFAAIALLALGEGASFAYAVTEETTTTTTANEKVLKTQETDASIKEAAEASSDKVEEVKEEATEETTEESTESTEEKEEKKAKGKTPRDASDPVAIPDTALYTWIIQSLNYYHSENITPGETVTKGQMEKLTLLYRGTGAGSNYDPIANLEGLQYAINLEEINFIGNKLYNRPNDEFTSLPTGFNKLTKLKKLNFYQGELQDIDELKDHPALTYFHGEKNNFLTLEGLSGCTKLEYLNVSGRGDNCAPNSDNIKNFKGLEKSTALKEIHFENNPGNGLQSLEGLNCSSTLEVLNLSGHSLLNTLDGLENYTALKEIRVVGGGNYNGRNYNYANPNNTGDLLFNPINHPMTTSTRGLKGAGAIDALSTCPALEKVNLSSNAIENINALADKKNLVNLYIYTNLIETLKPLSTSTNLKIIDARNNLLTNLKGLEKASSLEVLGVASQNSGAGTMLIPLGQPTVRYYLNGLLDDISALNTTSLKTLYLEHNRLEDLDVLKTASKLETFSAFGNFLKDTKGDFAGCVSLKEVRLNNNYFKTFEDMGLEASENSLINLYIHEQGHIPSTANSYSSDDSLLESLKGLENFSVIEFIDMHSNLITDAEMKYIPNCISKFNISHGNLQSKAFSTFNPTDFTRLKAIYASHNHISDISPLETIPTLETLDLLSQVIVVPRDGGEMNYKTGSIGFETKALKSDHGTGFTHSKYAGWVTSINPTFKIESGTYIWDVDDPNYDMNKKSPTIEFGFSGNDRISDFKYDGKITMNVDYKIDTDAQVELTPTDINGNKITEAEQGEIIYWRAKLKGKAAQKLIRPDIKHHLQYTSHQLVTSYTEALDPQKDEYVDGARVDIDGSHVSTPLGIWSQLEALDNMINNSNVANITVLTRVNDDAQPGKTVNLYFNATGKNFTIVKATETVLVKASGGQELKMSVPERLDFGKDNQADKRAKTYGLNAKGYSSAEKTKGLKIRVTDTKKTTSRTDWKVVGQLSDLTNTAAGKLENGSASPKLTIGNIGLLKVTNAGEASESTSPITTNTSGNGNPTWETSIDLTAGGSSTTLAEAPKVDGEGVWDYTIPFDDVKLEVPANVNNQAGRTFNGKITWTLEDVL